MSLLEVVVVVVVVVVISRVVVEVVLALLVSVRTSRLLGAAQRDPAPRKRIY